MIAEELINYAIPPLKPKDSSQMALLWMEEMRVHELPVIEKKEFKGMISEQLILENNDLAASVGDYNLVAKDCAVGMNQHLYDIIRLATGNEVDMVAVMGDKGSFMGVVTLRQAVKALAGSSAIQRPGGIVILSMKAIDYSLAELARIIEAESTKILSVHAHEDPETPHMLSVTLKLDRSELSHIVATLERFKYDVVGRFEEERKHYNEKDRIDLLLRYLDI
ncbi:hypothetical protein FUAX_10290 [Fulvitalea axinellae]|uniref:CBS domain-containing protein n=1 Tax=Fulvitalea axinellae TaxID=1182444 RepID=A0AAU9CNS8_9BACT|nr:hypothetical protein FUAX_10290 [Fulvitalea axinellae]